jgi:hypothetical protein
MYFSSLVLHQSCPLNKSFSRRIISLNGYFLLELNSKIIEQAYLCNTNGIFENLTEKIWLKDLLNTFELMTSNIFQQNKLISVKITWNMAGHITLSIILDQLGTI